MKDKQCTKIIGLTMTSESVKQIANDLFDLFGLCALLKENDFRLRETGWLNHAEEKGGGREKPGGLWKRNRIRIGWK